MDVKKKRLMKVLLVAGFVFVGLTILNGCGKEKEPVAPNDTNMAMTTEMGKEVAGTEQTMCPVMTGMKINEKYFVEYKGEKVYFCCPGCDEKFLADPEKYVANLPQFN